MPVSLTNEGIWDQNSGVVESPLAQGRALLDTSNNVYYSIDGIGPFLWDLIADGRSQSQLCLLARERFGAGAPEIERDIAEWLADMSRAGLVVERR